jgi:hypothetical protein
MAVLVILAIAAAIVLPEFGRHDDLKLASASRELQADLLFAQSRAMATGKTIYVHFDMRAGKYSLLESIDPPHVMRHPDSRLPYEVELGAGFLQGVIIESATFDGNAVLAFDAMGRPYSSGSASSSLAPLNAGSIVLSGGGNSQTLTIEPVTGHLKLTRDAARGETPPAADRTLLR